LLKYTKLLKEYLTSNKKEFLTGIGIEVIKTIMSKGGRGLPCWCPTFEEFN